MSTTTESTSLTPFSEMGLNKRVLKALERVGYETPTPIQAQAIPLLLQGRDLLGQAQTGTGKTAAFALPLLSRLNLKRLDPQVLVLAPTRELAIQVAEAFQTYAHELKGFHVVPVYGGQEYYGQTRALKHGAQVIVGTPGRVMDHMRRGTLDLGGLSTLVLDEADEMLRMGFIDDVSWILEQTPPERQTALFSATMPKQIRLIAQKHLRDPEQVTIQVKTTTADTIRQRFWPVSGLHKLDALTRILEAEPFEAMLVFVRTKTETVELSERLAARGFTAAPLNGDFPQRQRERTVEQFKSGAVDILVATDVAARGLDVERISHVLNYDIPYDTEAYVHRIGRTGRAGRKGDAILFVSPREKRMLFAIEKATRQKIMRMELPSTREVNDLRIHKFKQGILEALGGEGLAFYSGLVEDLMREHDVPALEVAAALARKLQGDEPFLLENKPAPRTPRGWEESQKGAPDRSARGPRGRGPEEGMERYRVDVGHNHKVTPGHLVGAIANEAGIDGAHIGRIRVHDEYSTVELPEGLPADVAAGLRKLRVLGHALGLTLIRDTKPLRRGKRGGTHTQGFRKFMQKKRKGGPRQG